MRGIAIGCEKEVCVRAGFAADGYDGRIEVDGLVSVVGPGNVLGYVGGYDGAAAVDGGGDAEEDGEEHGDEEDEECDEVFCMQLLGHMWVFSGKCFLFQINDLLCTGNLDFDRRLSYVTVGDVIPGQELYNTSYVNAAWLNVLTDSEAAQTMHDIIMRCAVSWPMVKSKPVFPTTAPRQQGQTYADI